MKKNWLDILGRTIITAIKTKTDNLPAAPASEGNVTAVGVISTAAKTEAEITESHFHNREYWFGKLAIQTATQWAERAGLTPFVAISGAGNFGSDLNDEAQVIGSSDTPVRVGSLSFDFRRISFVDVSNATPWVLRIIHGTGTMGDAETAGQYSEIVAHQQTAAGQNKAQDLITERVLVGEKIWVRAKNGTNNATIQFLVGVHEYPAPTQP